MKTPLLHHEYFLEISRSADGRRFGRRPISTAYLEPAREQTIFWAQRRGMLAGDLPHVDVGEHPQFISAAGGEFTSLELTVSENSDRTVRRRFGLDLFESLAETASAELVQSKQLEAGDEVVCRAFAQPAMPPATGAITSRIKRQPLPLLPGQLEETRRQAVAVGESVDGDYPVFLLDQALSRAQELSWKGRDLEGGVWLIGNLYQQSQPDPEIFAIVHTVLEARGAAHERYRIDLSAATFLDLQTQLQRRSKRFGCVGELVLGFYHTHPFLPSILDGKEACPSCALRPQCNLSSSFFSQQDAQFHSALFGRAAYALEFVLGLSPREEFDLRLFCLDGGRFRRRGYYRLASLPDFTRSHKESTHAPFAE